MQLISIRQMNVCNKLLYGKYLTNRKNFILFFLFHLIPLDNNIFQGSEKQVTIASNKVDKVFDIFA